MELSISKMSEAGQLADVIEAALGDALCAQRHCAIPTARVRMTTMVAATMAVCRRINFPVR